MRRLAAFSSGLILAEFIVTADMATSLNYGRRLGLPGVAFMACNRTTAPKRSSARPRNPSASRAFTWPAPHSPGRRYPYHYGHRIIAAGLIETFEP